MYISKIELINIRCFRKLSVKLKRNDELIKFFTILGDNAVGKSTILKCIAVGLCDESSAAGLMKEEVKAPFIRRG